MATWRAVVRALCSNCGSASCQYPQEGSLEQFITEHYWGYATQRSGGSVEYHVSHAPWQVSATANAGFEGDARALYGMISPTFCSDAPDCARGGWLAGHRLQGKKSTMKTPDLEPEPVLPRAGWILYDGRCGFCFRWVHLWKELVAQRGFALKDLQSASADGSLQVSPGESAGRHTNIDPRWKIRVRCQRIPLYGTANLVGMAVLCNLRFACFQLILYGDIVGLIETDTESRATVDYHGKPSPGASEERHLNGLRQR